MIIVTWIYPRVLAKVLIALKEGGFLMSLSALKFRAK